MSFTELFNQYNYPHVNSELNRLHAYISPANENESISEQYYYSSVDFNKHIKSTYDSKDKKSKFSFIHLNSRSIPRNFDHLNLFLSSIDINPTLICISETWLNDESNCDLYKRF